MKKRVRPIKDWFGYSRRERRATVVIMLAAVAVVLSRFFVNSSGELPEIVFVGKVMTKESILQSAGEDKPVAGQMTVRVSQREILNLNVCDSADLEKLPGIGPVLSARIIKYGNLLGGYADTRQLLEVYGLRVDVFERISGMVSADTSGLRRIRINTDDYRDILRHPYLDSEHVTAIVRYRERAGSISSWEEMVENNLIPVEKRDFLRHYISFVKYLD
ncbi:MAG: helix-hairpin-helix domain-containing protein [Bacteroidales bacterium]|jgi:DNA uptake protein ComE-like DNA-binding protein|nr:helix-hairpin-helix domain-containing protein [Bacteroidales bacterium]